MIHVAPCSCELHVEIRRLEAELAKAKKSAAYNAEQVVLLAKKPIPDIEHFVESNRQWAAMYVKEKVRAEKAEAQVFRWSQGQADMERKLADLEKDLEASEDRVAELERQLDEARSPSMHEYGDDCYEFVAENPPEREAD